jgi:TatA/E family protein of Tat protein translocase
VRIIVLGSQEIVLIIIFVIFILFGGAAIPKFAKSIGEAKAAFKKGQKDENLSSPDEKSND